jgi:hypothetical protein
MFTENAFARGSAKYQYGPLALYIYVYMYILSHGGVGGRREAVLDDRGAEEPAPRAFYHNG